MVFYIMCNMVKTHGCMYSIASNKVTWIFTITSHYLAI